MANSARSGIKKTAFAALVGTLATLGVAASAQAGCGHYEGSVTGTNSLPPLSSYFEHQKTVKASSHCRTKTTLKPLSQSFAAPAPVVRTQVRTAHIQTAPISPTVIGGLGHGEGLRPTSCPVAVHNPEGGKVLGCYNVVRKVVRPVTRTTYYQVVRPIIYVRYPVPVPVCALPTCATPHHHHHHHYGSRYGY